MIDDEDCDEATLTCFDFGLDSLQGEIKIKQFMGKKVEVRAAESSVIFAAGSQIGRIQVPEMDLHFQENAGHQIIDFESNDLCLFTT